MTAEGSWGRGALYHGEPIGVMALTEAGRDAVAADGATVTPIANISELVAYEVDDAVATGYERGLTTGSWEVLGAPGSRQGRLTMGTPVTLDLADAPSVGAWAFYDPTDGALLSAFPLTGAAGADGTPVLVEAIWTTQATPQDVETRLSALEATAAARVSALNELTGGLTLIAGTGLTLTIDSEARTLTLIADGGGGGGGVPDGAFLSTDGEHYFTSTDGDPFIQTGA